MNTEAIDKLIEDAVLSNSVDKRMLGADARKEMLLLRVGHLEEDRRTPDRVSLRKTVAGEFRRRAQHTVRKLLGEG